MAPASLVRKLSGQSALAQKVFASIPADEFWTLQQIQGELIRRGRHMAYNVMQGCVRCLVNAGLVDEEGVRFRAAFGASEAIEQDDEPAVASHTALAVIEPAHQPTEEAAPVTAPIAIIPASHEEAMTAITGRLTALSTEVIDTVDEVRQKLAKLTKLGKELEDVAIMITLEQDRVNDQVHKLEQLQRAMRELGLA